MDIDEISNIVRFCRKQGGLTQQELAHLSGVGKTVIFDLEKGKETVQLNTLLKILEALNIQLILKPPLVLPEKSE